MTDEPDDIAKWAESLSPEGAPGIMSQRMREFLGDQGYEKAMAHSNAINALYIQKQVLYNNILSLIVFFGVVFGLVGVTASVALVAKFLF